MLHSTKVSNCTVPQTQSHLGNMAVDVFIALDNFVTFFPTSEGKLLPVANPFDIYDEMMFWERYRLSKSIMKCLKDEVNVKLKFISFHS